MDTAIFNNPAELIIGLVLILSSLGVILVKKPVHASLSFLVTLLALAALYLQLSAQFIAVMQILIYAGAILVIFMFVMVLFQDAHVQITKHAPKSDSTLLTVASVAFLLILFFLGQRLINPAMQSKAIPEHYGTVQSLGQLLYVDYFFPFEAVILLFLIAVVGALYIGRKDTK